jgi:chromosomal replication initiator protein
VRLDPPGPASRRRFLLDRARVRGVRLAAEAVDALVESADGYRSLDGWLARLALTARVERRALDRSLVVTLLSEEGAAPALESGSGSSPADAAVLARIARDVAGRFGVTVRDLRAATRRKSVAEPRHLAMLLVRRHTGLSFQRIGDYFGGRDPATVRHACRASADRLASDPALAAAAEALTRRWQTVRPSRFADREGL